MNTSGIPRRPLVQPSAFVGSRQRRPGGCLDLPNRVFVRSGRAAIYWALRLMALPEGAEVLAPSYHCPTMIAPIVAAGHKPVFYPISEDGSPHLDLIKPSVHTRAMLVPHLFDRPLDLALVRQWCDDESILLVEDCAHSLFGGAGSRTVGEWGDFAVASLTKFLPVDSLGLIASAGVPLHAVSLSPRPITAQLRSMAGLLEVSFSHGRFGWLGAAASSSFRAGKRTHARRARAAGGNAGVLESEVSESEVLESEALEGELSGSSVLEGAKIVRRGRYEEAPSTFDSWIPSIVRIADSVARRRRNYRRLVDALGALAGGHPLHGPLPEDGTAPYVVPVYVRNPERIYPELRKDRFPVFRWDMRWPGTPEIHDVAADWSTHVLQLPCHQSLRDSDVDVMAARLRELIDQG